jgi:hypothetical protein
MKIKLTPEEYEVLLVALDRMDDDHHNCRYTFAESRDGVEIGLVFAPYVTACCFEGHILASIPMALGMTPPEFDGENWEPLWDFQAEISASDVNTGLYKKLDVFCGERLPVTDQQMNDCESETASGSTTWANDVYGTAAVRDAVRAGIAKGEIVVAS